MITTHRSEAFPWINRKSVTITGFSGALGGHSRTSTVQLDSSFSGEVHIQTGLCSGALVWTRGTLWVWQNMFIGRRVSINILWECFHTRLKWEHFFWIRSDVAHMLLWSGVSSSPAIAPHRSDVTFLINTWNKQKCLISAVCPALFFSGWASAATLLNYVIFLYLLFWFSDRRIGDTYCLSREPTPILHIPAVKENEHSFCFRPFSFFVFVFVKGVHWPEEAASGCACFCIRTGESTVGHVKWNNPTLTGRRSIITV